MNTRDKETFLQEAIKAFTAQRKAADACFQHMQECFICRGMVSKWTHWLVDFMFECHTIKNLAFEAQVAKADADEYRTALDEHCRIYYVPEETPSLKWLNDLYQLEDTRAK